VFIRLFGDKDKLAELYNAIHGTAYAPDDITMIKLENVLFKGLINDISFVLDGRLIILIEHQSTINPNMPLRFLLYTARTYLELVERETIYSSSLVKIMPPVFIVLYNGKDKYPEEAELKLSDAFIDSDINNLELIVKVYNVNKGHSPDIMNQSNTLNGYSILVSRAREYVDSGFEATEALKKAVEDCIRDNILKEFLLKHGSDVINMLSMEFNLEDAQKVWQKDGIKIGEQTKAEKVAEKMIKRGPPLEIIAEDTELSIERIKEIAKRLKIRE
jgi:predicted transposase/invertase (TIGR01784 family)